MYVKADKIWVGSSEGNARAIRDLTKLKLVKAEKRYKIADQVHNNVRI